MTDGSMILLVIFGAGNLLDTGLRLDPQAALGGLHWDGTAGGFRVS